MFHIDSEDISVQVLSCPAVVWMVRTDPFSASLLLELRDESSKTVSFGLVPGEGDALALVPGLENVDWWQGLEDFREGVLWLHGYEAEGLPLHQGLTAVEATSGEVLWSRPDAVYFGMIGPGLVARNGEGLDLLGLRSGEVLGGWENHRDPELLAEIKAYQEQAYANMHFPSLLPPSDPAYADWAGRLGVNPFGAMAVAETGGLAVLAWHEGSPAEGFALALAVFRGGELLLDGWLEEGMKGLHPDPFFIHAGKIIAVRGRRELALIGF